jgi:hypothetical protein
MQNAGSTQETIEFDYRAAALGQKETTNNNDLYGCLTFKPGVISFKVIANEVKPYLVGLSAGGFRLQSKTASFIGSKCFGLEDKSPIT